MTDDDYASPYSYSNSLLCLPSMGDWDCQWVCLSNSDSWQWGSNQSRWEPFHMLVLLTLLPTSSRKLSTLFSRPVPPNLLSASFSFCLNLCLWPPAIGSCCLVWEGGAPWGPKYIFSSRLITCLQTYTHHLLLHRKLIYMKQKCYVFITHNSL